MTINMGLDIGYSSVKLAYGSGMQPQLLTLPVGAAPIEQCPMRLDGELNIGSGFEVLIDGKPWVAGVEPRHFERFAPVLDESYPRSSQYMALFFAALLATNADHIGLLIVGLPVRQYRNKDERNALRDRLMGTHVITPTRSITVGNVLVVPQPAGAYYDVTSATSWLAREFRPKNDETVLCIDPGHFSLDWCVFLEGIKGESSDSSASAGEAILRTAAAALSRTHGMVVSQDKLERAVRSNLHSIAVGPHKIDITDAIEKASSLVINENMNLILSSIRAVSHSQGVDVVLLAGGGADMVEAAISNAFPHSRIIKSPSPVLANARGFWALAQEASKPSRSTTTGARTEAA